MTYRVVDITTFVHDDTQGVDTDLEDGLNQLESQGWELVAVAGQHKRWLEVDKDPESEVHPASLYGPLFIFHKTEVKSASLVN